MENVAVILAGGRGERFWPKSRKNCPKQFLSLTDDGNTLIYNTILRILPSIPIKNVFIVTNGSYKPLVEELCRSLGLPEKNIIYEPCPRNTAPAIATAAFYAQKRFGDAAMAILPSDHVIRDGLAYLRDFNAALELCREGRNLVTIGIKPTYGETGFGYIQFEKGKNPSPVVLFKEKPDVKTAEKYLQSGEFLWNSGQFFAKASTIIAATEEFSPKNFRLLHDFSQFIDGEKQEEEFKKCFEQCDKESFDIAVAEKIRDIFVISATFDWNDAGSFLSLSEIRKTDEAGNVVRGKVVSLDTENCVIDCDEGLVATVGIKDLIVVKSGNGILVCKKSENQQLREIIQRIKTEYGEDFL